jgi:hypothetical protein
MAIDIAANGDVVIVSAGTYFENIDFRGKGIRVQSSDGPGTTIIDGAQKDPVVRFDSGEGRNSVLKGFTLIHGYANPGHMSGIGEGGGIYMAASSPSIIGNIITQNSACDGGAVFIASPVHLVFKATPFQRTSKWDALAPKAAEFSPKTVLREHRSSVTRSSGTPGRAAMEAD